MSLLPREIREAPITEFIDATNMLAVVAEPFECPACHTARAFFVLTNDFEVGWTYCCVLCNNKAFREERR